MKQNEYKLIAFWLFILHWSFVIAIAIKSEYFSGWIKWIVSISLLAAVVFYVSSGEKK
jgi:hypothetical protein